MDINKQSEYGKHASRAVDVDDFPNLTHRANNPLQTPQALYQQLSPRSVAYRSNPAQKSFRSAQRDSITIYIQHKTGLLHRNLFDYSNIEHQ